MLPAGAAAKARWNYRARSRGGIAANDGMAPDHDRAGDARARAPAILDQFTRKLQSVPEILDAWYVTGDYDFALHIVARDMESFASTRKF